MLIKKSTFLLALLYVALIPSACKKFNGDITTPAFLQLDRIDVVSSGEGENERIEGWYTSNIDAVQFIAVYENDNKETNLGTYQLPCKVPVLHKGNVKRLEIIPVVKQNGISATRIEYPYLRHITLNDVTLEPGTVTAVGKYDAPNNQHYLEATYYGPDVIKQEFFENFEALHTEIHFTKDIVQWIKDDHEGASSGSSYGLIHTSKDKDGVYFEITDSIVVNNPGKYLYMEMDYKTDVEFRIGMRSPIQSGGNEYTYYAMSLYPQKEWKKIYINLGKLWAEMNHYNKFHVVFYTTNTEKIDGDTRIDNVKIITM